MHAAVFHVVVAWQIVLVAAIVTYAIRTRDILQCVLALDALALVLVGLFGVVAIYRREAGYLDIGLVLAILGFVQTVATVRLLEEKKGLR